MSPRSHCRSSARSRAASPQQASATVELKIPVTDYATTLAQLASGGTVGTELQLRQQAQDVTQQVADV